MDKNKLLNIYKDVLSIPLEDNPQSELFAGVFVDGLPNFTFEKCDAAFHSFRNTSQYKYPIYLFCYDVNQYEADKINQKYTDVTIYGTPHLNNSFLYNEWMINKVFRYIDPKHENLITFQEDGFPIKSGWEEYCLNFDYIGAPWRDAVRLKENKFCLPETKIGNGGMSFRKLSKIIEVMDKVEAVGGQDIIEGMYLDGQLRQNNKWIPEDAYFAYFGFGLNIFKPVTVEQAKRFSEEPLENYKNEQMPFAFHKID